MRVHTHTHSRTHTLARARTFSFSLSPPPLSLVNGISAGGIVVRTLDPGVVARAPRLSVVQVCHPRVGMRRHVELKEGNDRPVEHGSTAAGTAVVLCEESNTSQAQLYLCLVGAVRAALRVSRIVPSEIMIVIVIV